MFEHVAVAKDETPKTVHIESLGTRIYSMSPWYL